MTMIVVTHEVGIFSSNKVYTTVPKERNKNIKDYYRE